jgi:hypothetical protein
MPVLKIKQNGEWVEVGGGSGGEIPDNLVYVSEENQESAVVPLDADTLGGHPMENFVKKDDVVNNFTTTEEGFVADARALKVLNDSIAYTPTTHDSGESNFIYIDVNNFQDGIYEILSKGAYAMVVKMNGEYINLGPVAAYTNSSIPTMTDGILKFYVGGYYSKAYIRRKF